MNKKSTPPTYINPELEPRPNTSNELGLFGVSTQRADSLVVLIPVPWEVTTSYGGGTAQGPEAILNASHQIDLYDWDFQMAVNHGFHMESVPESLKHLNEHLKPKAAAIKRCLERGSQLTVQMTADLEEIQNGCETMVKWVKTEATKVISEGKIAGVVGGDHSCPLGLMQALSEHHVAEEWAVLHIDAHADLRQAYQGFTHSHASIMHNLLHMAKPPSRLVQVAVRDFCLEEFKVIQNNPRVQTFFDHQIKEALFSGKSYDSYVQEILYGLPQNIYVSFDIDGLLPELCPNTGTPVPGGLSFSEAQYLLKSIVSSGRKIIGFDLCEVAPPQDGSEWDANVGSRVLFKLCGYAAQSWRKLQGRAISQE